MAVPISLGGFVADQIRHNLDCAQYLGKNYHII